MIKRKPKLRYDTGGLMGPVNANPFDPWYDRPINKQVSTFQPVPELPSLEAARQVKVLRNDTLGLIAKKYNISVSELAKYNSISNPNKIREGQSILIPTTTDTVYTKKDLIEAYKTGKPISYDTKKLYRGLDESKIDNHKVILDYYKQNKSKTPYTVIDKKTNTLYQYDENNNVINQFRVGLGKDVSDKFTINSKNKKIDRNITGAGIYSTVARPSNESYAHDYDNNIVLLENERGLRQAMSIHQIPNSLKKQRESALLNSDLTDDDFSNGCINCTKEQFEQYNKLVTPGQPVYVLPEEPGNYFTVKDNKLSFTTNKNKEYGQYNFSPKSTEYTPLNIKSKNPSEYKDKFINALANEKKKLVKDLNLSSDEYDQLAKRAYGIFGQESSFGEGSWNPAHNYKLENLYTNLFDSEQERNSRSLGLTQIRMKYIDPAFAQKYGITTETLNYPYQSAVATIERLADAYQAVKQPNVRDKYENLTPENSFDYATTFYNKPETVRLGKASGNNSYVQNVNNFSSELEPDTASMQKLNMKYAQSTPTKKTLKYTYGGTYQPVGYPNDPAQIRAQKAQAKKEAGNFWSDLGKFATNYALPIVATAVGGPAGAALGAGLRAASGVTNPAPVNEIQSPTTDYVDPTTMQDPNMVDPNVSTQYANKGGWIVNKVKPFKSWQYADFSHATGGPIDPIYGPYKPLGTDTIPAPNYIPAVMRNTPVDSTYDREYQRANARQDMYRTARHNRRMGLKSQGIDYTGEGWYVDPAQANQTTTIGNSKSKSKDRYREYATGGDINIKPSKRGTFTAAASKHGESVQQFASQVLANRESYSPAMVKKANFARNAAKWHHDSGGDIQLSSNSFQVKGNPQVTDGNTYNMNNNTIALDHNEVVDKNFVFSDNLTNPLTGNKFSTDAKPIQKGIGRSEKKVAKYNDMIAANTLKFQQSASDELKQVHEAVATSKGLRNSDGSTKQNFATGGYGPDDPPYTLVKEGRKPGLGLYYDPNTGNYLRRNSLGKYTPVSTDDQLAYRTLYEKPTPNVNYNPQDQVQRYATRPDGTVEAISEYTFDYSPSPNFPFKGQELLGAWIRNNGYQEDTTSSTSNPIQAGTRRSSIPKTKAAIPKTRPTILPSSVQSNTATPDYVTLPDGSRIPAELNKPLAKSSAPMTADQRAALTEHTPYLTDADLAKYNKPWQTDAGYQANFDEKGNVVAPTPDYMNKGYQTPFTIGDALQGAEVGLKLWNALKPSEVEPTRQINTPITQQSYDVSVPLYNSQRQYQNALNSYSGSLNTRRAVSANMLAAKTAEDNNILARYQDMNNTARLQFEDRLGQRRAQNIALQQYSADINSRNQAARANLIDSSLTGVGNFGQALNQKVKANDTMNILSRLYPNTYQGVEEALSYDDYLKLRKRNGWN